MISSYTGVVHSVYVTSLQGGHSYSYHEVTLGYLVPEEMAAKNVIASKFQT